MSPPGAGRCQEWLARKNRCCGQAVVAGGGDRCVFHAPSVGDGAGRVQCGPCRTWMSAESFRRHSRGHCPFMKVEQKIRCQPYYQENCNCAVRSCGAETDAAPSDGVSDERLLEIYQAVVDPDDDVESKDYFELGEGAITPSVKHGAQHRAILSHVGTEPFASVVEMGAGKADLLEAILSSRQRGSRDAISGVAIDMSTFHHSADPRLRRLCQYRRVTINLRDLALKAINLPTPACAVSKHLCGVGLDFAFRAIVNAGSGIVALLAMAPCCYHKCTWRELTGRDLLEDHGVKPHEFAEICRRASWSTQLDADVMDERKFNVGRSCKRIIDACRLSYLRRNGFPDARLVAYVDSRITTENMLIIAKRSPISK
ncbi:tRNA:m(4)X modification enzyme TRM13 [Plasmodiophora brassicae]